ncbi:hypothetical protein HK097_004702, partial [Rhizophlyctis rosea]
MTATDNPRYPLRRTPARHAAWKANGVLQLSPLPVPPELFFIILKRLPYGDLKKCARVSALWKAAADYLTYGKELSLTLTKTIGRKQYEVKVPMYLRQRLLLDPGTSQYIVEFIPAAVVHISRSMTVPNTLTISAPSLPTSQTYAISTGTCLPYPSGRPTIVGPTDPDFYSTLQPPVNSYYGNWTPPVYNANPSIRLGQPYQEGVQKIYSSSFTLRFGWIAHPNLLDPTKSKRENQHRNSQTT